MSSHQYTDAVLADTPRSYYRMNEASGNLADSSGNAITYNAIATIHYHIGGAVGTDDVADFAIHGDTNGYLQSGATPSFDPGNGPFTVEIWFKPDSDTAALIQIEATSFGPPSSNADIALRIRGENSTGCEFTINAPTFDDGLAATLCTYDSRHWNYLVVTGTGTGGTFNWYLNGRNIKTVAMPAYTQPAILQTIVGAFYFAGPTPQFTTFAVDELAYYHSVLSPTRILAHYNLAGYALETPVFADAPVSIGITATETFEITDTTCASYPATVMSFSPVTYWRCNELAGTAMLDYTGNGHTGTLSANGVLNQSPAFDGSIRAVQLDNVADTARAVITGANSAFSPSTGDFTIIYWGYFNQSSGALPQEVSWVTALGQAHVRIAASAWLFVNDAGASGGSSFVGGIQIWDFIAFCYNSGTQIMTCYGGQSGVLSSSTASIAPNSGPTTGGMIFGGITGTNSFHGNADEIAFFHTNLTANQISQIYESAFTCVKVVTPDTITFTDFGISSIFPLGGTENVTFIDALKTIAIVTNPQLDARNLGVMTAAIIQVQTIDPIVINPIGEFILNSVINIPIPTFVERITTIGTNTTVNVATGATAVVITPPTNNANSITFKGVSGDTGVILNPTQPSVFTLDPSVATFILNASAPTNVTITFI